MFSTFSLAHQKRKRKKKKNFLYCFSITICTHLSILLTLFPVFLSLFFLGFLCAKILSLSISFWKNFLDFRKPFVLFLNDWVLVNCVIYRERERERVMAMLHVSSACYFNLRQRRLHRIRGVASEDFAGLKVEEKKVKLGGSDLKVTKLGIGAWSWGDTSYWNNFEWDGKLLQKSLIKRRNYR